MVEKVMLVDDIATVIISAIDDLVANEKKESDVIKIIKGIVSVKAYRLKILDGVKAKARFQSKMGKGRMEKFYPLLEKAEK